MTPNPIVIISGSPGSGKSSVSRLLAENSPHDKTIHFHTDDFYHSICKGYIAPWRSEAEEQNTTIIESFTASVARLAVGGYEVIVDGVIGPWFLSPWLDLVKNGFDVRYVILRPDEQTTVKRASERDKIVDNDAVKNMWQAFKDLGSYKSHAIDTSCQSISETTAEIRRLLNDNAMSMK